MSATPFHYHQPRLQPFAEDQVRVAHREALFGFGEWAMFVLMWRPVDEEDGLVERCTLCYEGEGRSARAYAQGARQKCLSCYGTTFEGGYRARVIRPALFTERVLDTTDSPRGTVVTDTVTVETYDDFTFHHGDFIFRAAGERYQGEEKGVVTVRSGFGSPTTSRSIAGTISSARLEDRNAVAHLIPPDAATLAAILTRPVTEHLPPDLSAFEVARASLLR